MPELSEAQVILPGKTIPSLWHFDQLLEALKQDVKDHDQYDFKQEFTDENEAITALGILERPYEHPIPGRQGPVQVRYQQGFRRLAAHGQAKSYDDVHQRQVIRFFVQQPSLAEFRAALDHLQQMLQHNAVRYDLDEIENSVLQYQNPAIMIHEQLQAMVKAGQEWLDLGSQFEDYLAKARDLVATYASKFSDRWQVFLDLIKKALNDFERKFDQLMAKLKKVT